jgi:hypothetical protein
MLPRAGGSVPTRYASSMVVIFGWGGGDTKDLGEVAPALCPNCHNDVYLHHITTNKQVSLYFIPLAKYGDNQYLACPICHAGMAVDPKLKMTVDQMRAATASFRRGRVPQDHYVATVRAFWAKIGVNPSGQQVVRPASAGSAAAGPGTGPVSQAPVAAAPKPPLAEQLARLGELRAQGILSEEEFAAAKARLLRG